MRMNEIHVPATENVGPSTSLDQVPITERSNSLSIDIDIASPEGIAKILYACDQEIFAGWGSSNGLRDLAIIQKMNEIAALIFEVIQLNTVQNPKRGCVVIGGCGTSGRLAFLTTRRFNKLLRSQGREECFKYIISGNNDALFSSIELAEDDPSEGAKRLKEVVEGKTRVVFVGVTCGMSAPFVAGQLEVCLADLHTFTPVLLGFNHTHQARKTKMQHSNKTFQEVVGEMTKAEQNGKAFILNPIIGPEPIAGSSRMKSGTTTKIVLEILSLLGLNCNDSSVSFSIPQLLGLYKDVCQAVYSQAHSLGSLVLMAGESLRNNGHLYYLGRGGIGLMGVIDASECPPTFGAEFHDIRGFVDGGIDGLDSKPISNSLSTEDFKTDIIPNLNSIDTVIVFGSDMLENGKLLLSSSQCKKVFVNFFKTSNEGQTETSGFDLSINIDCTAAIEGVGLQAGPKSEKKRESIKSSKELVESLLIHLAQEAAMKWTVNCISTGAHIYLGKVYKNLMVDVRVSNVKLFHRACGIIMGICKLGDEDSKKCLLKAIYVTDNLSEAQETSCIVDHVLAASKRNKVVPTAILLGLVHCQVQQACYMLNTQPKISQILKDYQPKTFP